MYHQYLEVLVIIWRRPKWLEYVLKLNIVIGTIFMYPI